MKTRQVRSITKIGLKAGREANVKASQISWDLDNKMKELPKLISVSLFAAAYKSYRSACLLLNKGYEESAIILSRTIIEISLQAIYLRINPGIAERYGYWAPFEQYRHYLRLLNDNDEVLSKIFSDGDPSEIKPGHDIYLKKFRKPRARETSATAAAREKEDIKEIKRLERAQWHGLNSVSALAKECGTEAIRDYKVTYWLQSNLTHANPFGANKYIRLSSEGVQLRSGPNKCIEGTLVQWRTCLAFLNVIDCLNHFGQLKMDIDKSRREVTETYASLE